jgi:glutamate-1-semialdehyde 2,1-aminomutase
MAVSTHHTVQHSLTLYDRALELIPGAAQLISRRASRFAYGVSPIYAVRAKGSRIWDVDGNEFIDWMSSVGAIILGYADEVVDAAVKEQIDKGAIYTLNHEREIELAEKLTRTIPSAEMVRYAKGGGEACAIAVRIARGTTGRDKVLFCGYHGWHDWYLAANLVNDGALDEHLFPGIEPIGVPKALAGTIYPFRYGDLNMLEDLLQQHAGEVACVIMEPMRSENPPVGYLEGVRELATQHEVVLIFDEVSTGPRPSLGGAQEYLGVTPDMSVWAKAMSNGYAMGAVVGKRWAMEPASGMFVSSTYWSDTIGITAALTTLRELRRRNAVAHIHRIGRLIKEQMNAAIAEVGIDAECAGCDWHPGVRFYVNDAALQKKVITLYVQEMAKRGIFTISAFYINAAHSADDVAQTVAAAKEAFAVIKDGLDNNRVDKLLEARVIEDSFRRLVV